MKKNNSKKSWAYELETTHILNFALFFTVIAVVGVLAVALPKPKISEYEKRDLAAMPQFTWQALFSGSYTKDLELFFADTFPAREKFVEISARMEDMRGMRMDDVKIHEQPSTSQSQPPSAPLGDQFPAQQPEIEQEQQAPPAQEQAPQQPSELQAVENDVEGEKRGSVFLYKDMALPMFGGNKPAGQQYAQVITNYSEVLGDSVTVYNLIIPSAIEFYLPEKYKDQGITGDEKDNIDYIYSQMGEKVHTVDAYSKMDQAKDQYIYFRTDHHWTARGAYAAYQAFCQEAGLTPVPLEDMEYHRIDGFVGSLYGQTQEIRLKENPDYVEYFVPPQPHTTYRYVKNEPYTPYPSTVWASYATSGPNTYSVFLHGDFPLTHIITGQNTGRKIAVVKESFGNAFSPFLISHYDEIFVVDQRYFQLGFINFIQQNGINELLFINNVFAANTYIRINEISRIMYQQFVPPVYTPPVEEPEEETQPEEIEVEEEEKPKKAKKKKPVKKDDDEDDDEDDD